MQNFFSNAVFLNTAEPAAGDVGALFGMLPMILLFVLFAYFLLYRPQKKREREVNDMRNSLRVGDEISTTGGIFGKILQIKDDFIVIETGSDKTKLKIAKWAIRSIEAREDDDEYEDDDDE